MFARRLQIQERMRRKSPNRSSSAATRGRGVVCEARHFWHDDARRREAAFGRVTSAMRSVFASAKRRGEFLALVRQHSSEM